MEDIVELNEVITDIIHKINTRCALYTVNGETRGMVEEFVMNQKEEFLEKYDYTFLENNQRVPQFWFYEVFIVSVFNNKVFFKDLLINYWFSNDLIDK